MTIKKKLFISNILMIIIPTVVSLLFLASAFLFYTNTKWDGLEDLFHTHGSLYSAQAMTYNFDAKHMDLYVSQMKKLGYDVEILSKDKVLHASTDMSSVIEKYDKEASVTLSTSKFSFIKETIHKKKQAYTIYAYNKAPKRLSGFSIKIFLLLCLLVGLFVILLIVFVTNQILSRWISKSIMQPLHKILEGTKEIENGNLEYQIQYQNMDEFNPVCTSFNAMSQHLKQAQSEKLAYEQYRKELISGISHDLRTPLTSIKGYTEGLLEGVAKTEEKQKHYYQVIHDQSLQMEELIDHLSNFNKLENNTYTYHFEPVNLDLFMKKIIHEYANEKLIIQYTNSNPNEMISMDSFQIKCVFMNIISNSIKYKTKDICTMNIHIYKDDKIHIDIQDDGPGVSKENLDKIFHIFYREEFSRTTKGNGLGLAICKQIINDHHGTIYATSDSGLCLHITLESK